MEKFEDLLAGGDRRSIGRVNEVVETVIADPERFGELFQVMSAENEVLRMRAADAVEKISREDPEFIQPHKSEILLDLSSCEQQEVRWHWAQMVTRLRLRGEERMLVVGILVSFLDDSSKIVKTCAMQALAELAEKDPVLRPEIVPLLMECTETGSPAMRSRGKKLLRELGEAEEVMLPSERDGQNLD